MGEIKSIDALEVLDSRGNPTLAVSVLLTSGVKGTATVPSGASVGSKEARELRDEDPDRFNGRGVIKARENVLSKIAPVLTGLSVIDQTTIDEAMISLDGTNDKSDLGANAILGVSLATAHAAAIEKNMPLYRHIAELIGFGELTLPVPMCNVLNGGAHANNNLAIQEFMIIPAGFSSFHEAIRCAVEIFQQLKLDLDHKGYSTAVGDEGGFAIDLDSDRAAIELLCEAIGKTNYELERDVWLGLDCAASEFHISPSGYQLTDSSEPLAPHKWLEVLIDLTNNYPAILSIEDGMDEAAISDWQLLTKQLGSTKQLVGDDLFVTDKLLLTKGIKEKWANSILVKPNQIGTLSETLEVIKLAKKHQFTTVISHRSGETEDTSIADIAVGTRAGQIKTGSLSRSERVAKYNRLLQIEQEIGARQFKGLNEFRQL